MKVDRRELEHQLYVVMGEHALDKKIKNSVASNLLKHNITEGETIAYFNRNIPLETLNDNILYLLTKYLYIELQNKDLNPGNYFYESEISQGNLYQKPDYDSIEGDLVIKNVLQGGDDRFICYMPIQEIARLYDSGRVFYNAATQRGMIASKQGETIIQRIDIRQSAINAMVDKMLSGKYIENILTFNILKDGNDDIYYESRHNTLTINKEAEIDVIDGFHRSQAILKALLVDPNLDLNMEVRITNWTAEKARAFIIQEDHRTPLKKADKRSLDDEKKENQVVRFLNEQPMNEMQYKIATDYNMVRHHRAYTTHAVMADAIKDNFTLRTTRDVRKVSQFLIDFFNELISIYIDDFDNLELSRNERATTYANMFYGYIRLAGNLIDKEDWEVKLERMLRRFDFNLTNNKWDELKIIESKLTKREIEDIYRYFDGMVVGV